MLNNNRNVTKRVTRMGLVTLLVVLAQFFQLSSHAAQPEQLVIPLSNPDTRGTLVVRQVYGSLSVSGYDGKEVLINARQSKVKKVSKKKNGLTRISSNLINIEVEERNNVVNVVSRPQKGTVDLEISIPRDFDLKLTSVNDGNTQVRNVRGALEISHVNGGITLEEVSGSAIVDTTNGDVKVRFDKVNADANMAFSSHNGDVDISFPESFAANIKARTENGDIYTNVDLDLEATKPVYQRDASDKSYKVKLEQWVTGKVNGGGPETMFRTYNGDILLRFGSD